MKLVLAKTYERFRFWCEEHGVSPYPHHDEARYISRERDLRGLRGADCEIVKVAGWTDGKHWVEVDSINSLVQHLAAFGATITRSD